LKFQVYEARRGLMRRKQWRWRIKAPNGRTIGDSAESYNNKGDCIAMAEGIIEKAGKAKIEVLS
jgi:uncharacterized protein YegP (UPF0339 family)